MVSGMDGKWNNWDMNQHLCEIRCLEVEDWQTEPLSWALTLGFLLQPAL